MNYNGFFTIDIVDDLIYFSTEYLAVTAEWRCECDDNYYKNYYVKDSGYDLENKTSNFCNFIREISNKYS